MYTYVCVCVCMCIYIYIYIYVCVCVCVCVCVFNLRFCPSPLQGTILGALPVPNTAAATTFEKKFLRFADD